MEGEQLLNTDVISNLPMEIMDAILVRMPLKDAVRTSILSHNWRHKWVTISQLVFHNFELGIPHSKRDRIVSIIDQILLRHQGSISKFELTALAECSHIDRWMLYLSRNGVKELILVINGYRYYSVPAYLFHCQALTHLVLSNCFLKLTSTFEGFPCLKSLELSGVNTASYSVDKLISKCPLLERLELFACYHSCKKINAPNLKFLKVDASYESFILENVPLIEYACISFLPTNFESHNNECECNHFLSLCSLPKITELILSFSRDCKVPSFIYNFRQLTDLELKICTFRSPSTFIGFPSLEKLVLGEVNFVNYDLDTLISNSPFLEILDLTSFDHSLVKLNAPNIKILCIHILEKISPLVASPLDFFAEGDTAKDSPLSDYNFLQSVTHFPNIIELEVDSPHGLRQRVADNVPRTLATTFDFMDNLTLSINFRNTNDILACLCLLRCSSNLRKLEIRGNHYHRKRLGNYWKVDEDLDLYMENLRWVKFTGVVTLGLELEFIKVVLASSPVLEKLTIECSRFVTRKVRSRIFVQLHLLKTSSLTEIRIS